MIDISKGLALSLSIMFLLFPGADIGSDHNPLIAKMSVRLKRAMPSSQKKEFIDWG